MKPEIMNRQMGLPGGRGRSRGLCALVFLVLSLACLLGARADWPAWRGDARRSATTDEELPGKLSLHWRLELPPLAPAWPDQPRLQFDVCYQPISAGGKVFVASPLTDSVSAYSLKDGTRLWRFFTDGPVRFAPFFSDGRLYACSDDGYLYCLEASSGKLLWRHRGGPSGRKVLGNGRMISSWPARGAPVVKDGKVYYGASIWPFMGTYVHCLDAVTGKVLWTNDTGGALFIDQPHNSPAFGGLAPQGYLAAVGDRLLVPNGRAVPACLDQDTGRLLYYRLAKNAKKESYHVSATGNVFLNSGMLYGLAAGEKIKGTLGADTALDSAAAYSAAVVKEKDAHLLRLKAMQLGKRVRFDRQNFHATWKDDARGASYEISIRGGKVERLSKSIRGAEPKLLESISYLQPNKYKTSKGKTVLAGVLSYKDSVVPSSSLGKEGAKAVETICRTAIYPTPANWTCLTETRIPLHGKGKAARAKPGLGGPGGLPTRAKFEMVFSKARLVEVEKLRNVDGEIPKRTLSSTLPRGLKRQLELGASWRISQALFPLLKNAEGVEVLDTLTIRCGDRIYVACAGNLLAFDMPRGGVAGKKRPKLAWKKKLPGIPGSLGCSGGRLLVATREGSILCFGAAGKKKPVVRSEGRGQLAGGPALSGELDELLKSRSSEGGYCLVAGGTKPAPVEALLSRTKLRLLVLEKDPARLAGLREKLVRSGHYGRRVSVHLGAVEEWDLPAYFANIACVGGGAAAEQISPAALASVFRSLRPYGGIACFLQGSANRAQVDTMIKSGALEGAAVKQRGDALDVSRPGPLARTGSWTHQYGDGSNSNISRDFLVKAPLGLLWFGGVSNTRLLPRHGHGPRHHVVGGRIVIEGPDILRALDVYTGRQLWEAELPGLGKPYDNTAHQPGANAIGSNYVSTSDAIYVLYGKACLKLDPRTGKVVSRIQFETEGKEKQERSLHLGFLSISDDLLVLGASPMQFSTPDFDRYDLNDLKDARAATLKDLLKSVEGFKAGGKSFLQTEKSWLVEELNRLLAMEGLAEKLSKAYLSKANAKKLEAVLQLLRLHRKNSGDTAGLKSLNRRLLHAVCAAVPEERTGKLGNSNVWDGTASRYLGGFDRHSGKALWRISAENSYRHNAICLGGGKLFTIDRLPEPYEKKLRRRGRSAIDRTRVLAVNLSDGAVAWKKKATFYGTFLSYSAEHDILLQSSRASRDMLPDEKGSHMLAHRGQTGEVLWQSRDTYDGPCILHHDTIIAQGKAFELLTGKPRLRLNPVLQRQIEWGFSRQYGCNTAIASEHLLTFRSAAAGFFDLAGNSGTGNLGGFRSSCTANLICGDGVLCAPDYTRSCNCSYQNQSSLGLVHMPELGMWTFNTFSIKKETVRRLGVNLGAPGDRLADDGTLWLEYPIVGGPSPKFEMELEPPTASPFRQSPGSLGSDSRGWIFASGYRGLDRVSLKLPKAVAGTFTVKLYFRAPTREAGGSYSISLQGKKSLEGLDPDAGRTGGRVGVVHEISGVQVGSGLELALSHSQGKEFGLPLICGIELIHEGE